MCLQPQISQPKLGQIGHVGGVLKTSGPADSKSVPGFDNWPRFVGVIEQNKISNSYENYCIYIYIAIIPPIYLSAILSINIMGNLLI